MAEFNSTEELVREESGNRKWSGVDVDTATLVSIVSSAIILVSGCVAVICLIVYMKKTESLRAHQLVSRSGQMAICAKCGQTLAGGEVARVPTGEPKMATNESALYAISKSLVEEKEESLLGFICGHIIGGELQMNSNSNEIHMMKAVDDTKRHPTTVSCPSQCSSNHSELIRAYECAQQCKRKHRLSFESIVDIYESIGGETDRETPTDPGIREFTECPPKPNERRIGVVQHVTDDSSDDTTPNDFFGAIPRTRSRKPLWKLSSDAETIKCLSSLTSSQINGLSDDETDDQSVAPSVERQRTVIDC